MAGGHVLLFTLDGRPLIGKGSFEMVETITPLPDEWLDRGMLPRHRRPKILIVPEHFRIMAPLLTCGKPPLPQLSRRCRNH